MIKDAVAVQHYSGKHKFLECESGIALICVLCDGLQREYNKELLIQQPLHPFSMCVKARERHRPIKANLFYKSSGIKFSDL